MRFEGACLSQVVRRVQERQAFQDGCTARVNMNAYHAFEADTEALSV